MAKSVRLGILVVAFVLGAVAVSAILQSRAEDRTSVGAIKDSYAFDVKNKAKLMGFADAAFVGTVVDKEATIDSAATTVWRVSVSRAVKGSPTGEVFVRQLGYVDGDGQAHVTEEQPMLEAGRRYLLVTTVDAQTGQHTLIAGPAASVPVGSAARESQLVVEYQRAR